MLTFPRSAALRFRQILKRSVTADLARGAGPLVLCQARRNELTLEAGQGGVAVRLYLDAPGASGAVALRPGTSPRLRSNQPGPRAWTGGATVAFAQPPKTI